jgi:hypothetical protein
MDCFWIADDPLGTGAIAHYRGCSIPELLLLFREHALLPDSGLTVPPRHRIGTREGWSKGSKVSFSEKSSKLAAVINPRLPKVELPVRTSQKSKGRSGGDHRGCDSAPASSVNNHLGSDAGMIGGPQPVDRVVYWTIAE